MLFHKIVEALIKEAQESGQFNNLPGKGNFSDLTTYFEMPEDVGGAIGVEKRWDAMARS